MSISQVVKPKFQELDVTPELFLQFYPEMSIGSFFFLSPDFPSPTGWFEVG